MNWLDRYALRVLATDLAALILASTITLSVGPHPPSEPLVSRLLTAPYWLVLLVGAGLWILAALALGAYDRGMIGEGYEEFRRVLLATATWLGTITLLAFVTVTSLSRAAVLWMVVLVGVLSLLGRDLNRRWLRGQREKGIGIRRVVVLGDDTQAQRLSDHLATAPWSGYRVVSVSSPDDPHTPLTDPLALVRQADADTLAIADAAALGPEGLRSLAEAMEGSGCELLVVPSLTEVAGPRIRVRPVGGLPLLQVDEPRLTGPARLAKAAMDRVLALAFIILLALPMLVIAAIIRFTSPGPALFSQVRTGIGGRPFTLYKFRSMVNGAESQLDAIDENDADGPLFKLRDDPRVTRVGAWLRRHSLDELPQLWNVLKGEMSLVGPRPMLPSEVDGLSARANRRLLVKPGITGLWQVSGRSEVAWAQAVRLDLYYVENWSLSLDLIILFRTIVAVVQGRGAY